MLLVDTAVPCGQETQGNDVPLSSLRCSETTEHCSSTATRWDPQAAELPDLSNPAHQAPAE